MSAISRMSAPANRNVRATPFWARSTRASASPAPTITLTPATVTTRVSMRTEPTSAREWTEKPGGLANSSRPSALSRRCSAADSPCSFATLPNTSGWLLIVGNPGMVANSSREEAE